MCDCNSKSNCNCNVPAGPQGPQGPQGDRGVPGFGTDGTDGTDGVSVVAEYVSDGVTPINGTVYVLNTLIMELSDGTFINAGVISPINDLVWIEIPLLNSWTATPGYGTPQYAIDNNFVHFRGVITPGLTDNAFSIPALTPGTNVLTSIQNTTIPSSEPSIMILDTIGSVRILDFAGHQANYMLDSVPALSIIR